MSKAFDAAFYAGLGTVIAGLGLENLLINTAKVQNLAESYLVKADPITVERVQQAYRFAEQALGTSHRLASLSTLVFGGLLLGTAVYEIAKSHEKKE